MNEEQLDAGQIASRVTGTILMLGLIAYITIMIALLAR